MRTALNFEHRPKAIKYIILYMFIISIFLMFNGCGKEKIIIREIITAPPPVSLISPVNDTLITVANPVFEWHPLSEVLKYQIHVSLSPSFTTFTINAYSNDTSYTTITEVPNGSYFWRVRAQNTDSIWGDWSDSEVRTFYKTDYVYYMNFLASAYSVGIAQDLYVRNDTAFVADGQAELTLFDVSNKNNPFILKNYDSIDDDFASAVYISPVDSFPYVWVADRDGKVQGINLQDTTFLTMARVGRYQNVQDVTGEIINDTLYIFAVSSRGSVGLGLSVVQIVYDPFARESGTYFIPEFQYPADANGVFYKNGYVYVACGVAGLLIYDFTDMYSPLPLSSLELTGSALKVFVDENYAYIAGDRSGLFVIDITDPASPAVLSNVNTSGRTKDVYVIDSYAFIADGSGGLKILDVSVPDSAYFVAAYSTPYAYGVWADSDYIYICDRDEGLMIFENLVSQ